MPLKRWEVVFRVDMTGPFLCCQGRAPRHDRAGRRQHRQHHLQRRRPSGAPAPWATAPSTPRPRPASTASPGPWRPRRGRTTSPSTPSSRSGVVGTEGMRMWATEEQKKTFDVARTPWWPAPCSWPSRTPAASPAAWPSTTSTSCWHGLEVASERPPPAAGAAPEGRAMMRAVVYHGPDDIRLETVPRAGAPGPRGRHRAGDDRQHLRQRPARAPRPDAQDGAGRHHRPRVRRAWWSRSGAASTGSSRATGWSARRPSGAAAAAPAARGC